MARLLTDTNIKGVTLSENVRNLIDEFKNQWLDSEQVAQAEMISYLSQRYIIDQVFTNTSTWLTTILYKAKNLIQYHEADWSDLTTYSGYAAWVSTTTYSATQTVNYRGYRYTSLGNGNTFVPTDATKWSKGAKTDRVNYKGYIYESNAVGGETGYVPTNTTYWTLITEDYSLYYVTLPYDEWDSETTYAAGDQVWFLDYTYTCLKANSNLNPSDSANVAIWGSGTAYALAAAILPDDTTYWTKGDNRNQLIVRFLLDISAYHFMRAVPARGIPEHIKEAYNGNDPMDRGGAIGWLKRVAAGEINADLPEIIITQGLAFTGGSSRAKQDNFLW
jgi:hypothetical protein